jgi:ArsR family transcriptional regulator
MISNLNEFFKVLGDNTRLRIINLLIHFPALNVNDLCSYLHQPQSKISRHLNILRHGKWVLFYRRDKWVYYKLNPEVNQLLINVLKEMFQGQLQFESDLLNARGRSGSEFQKNSLVE